MHTQIQPADDRLKRKLGGAAKTAISPAIAAKAEQAAAAIAAQVRPVLMEQLAELEACSRQRPFNAPTMLYGKAHMIRGVAGTCGLPSLGLAAKAMCELLDGVEDGAMIDANLVTSIAITMLHAAKGEDNDPALLQELIGACHEAVALARPRRG